MPPRHARFRFTETRLQGRRLGFGYRLEGGPDPAVDLEETLDLPEALPAPDPADPAVARGMEGIHRILGVSYWKTSCPPEITFSGSAPGPREAAFWEEVWTSGLGEFFYRNGLDPRGRVAFPAGATDPAPIPVAAPDAERVLVLVGGGKDSAVSREVVRHAGVEADLLSVGDPPWIRRSAEAMGGTHLVVRRRLDPALFELNARGALDGHVPISAAIALVAWLVALTGGYAAVISSNERSASAGNVSWHGLEVNHQWSKGLRFEGLLRDHLAASFTGGPTVFSLLRPLTELAIGRAFARHPRYFEATTSCNANFRVRDRGPVARWCGRCPKCVFVQLVLAPHLAPAALDRLFGRDFLTDPANLPLLEELAGVRGIKPFECVGTPEEVAAALWRLDQDGRLPEPARSLWRDRVRPAVADPVALWNEALAPAAEHHLSPAWEERLHAYLRAG